MAINRISADGQGQPAAFSFSEALACVTAGGASASIFVATGWSSSPASDWQRSIYQLAIDWARRDLERPGYERRCLPSGN